MNIQLKNNLPWPWKQPWSVCYNHYVRYLRGRSSCTLFLYPLLCYSEYWIINKCFLLWCYVYLKVTLFYTMNVSSHNLWPWLMFFLLWMLSLMRTPWLMSMRVYLHGGGSLSRHRCEEIGGNETWKQRESIIDCWVLRE